MAADWGHEQHRVPHQPITATGRQLLRSAARTITSVVTECNQATRTMSQLRLAPDRFLPDAGQAAGRLRRIPVPHLGPLVARALREASGSRAEAARR